MLYGYILDMRVNVDSLFKEYLCGFPFRLTHRCWWHLLLHDITWRRRIKEGMDQNHQCHTTALPARVKYWTPAPDSIRDEATLTELHAAHCFHLVSVRYTTKYMAEIIDISFYLQPLLGVFATTLKTGMRRRRSSVCTLCFGSIWP